MTEPTAQPASAAATPPDGSLRDTFEHIIFAFVLAFTFRAFVVEAFVIPTGSMAPTLLGEHLRLVCPDCGYHFNTDPSENVRGEPPCPMCQHPIPLQGLTARTGDRILVLKYIYGLQEPARWDVVVFKNPEKPDQNYIKRLTGLPNEQLCLVRGNLFTRPLKDSEAADPQAGWEIRRKTDRPEIQEVVWQPVYHSDYQPLDRGEGRSTHYQWAQPWQAVADSSDRFSTEAGDRRWKFDGQGNGELGFLFDTYQAEHYHAYNLLESGGPFDAPEDRIEEVRLSATLTPLAPGLIASLLCTSRGHLLRALIGSDSSVRLQIARLPEDLNARSSLQTLHWEDKLPAPAQLPRPLTTGRPVRLELWHADQSIALRADGNPVAQWNFSLRDLGMDLKSLERFEPFYDAPLVRLQLQGAPATLRSLDLDRDIYYTRSRSRARLNNPMTLGPDQFFCMGDNSPRSHDSRAWGEPASWVRYHLDANHQNFYTDSSGALQHQPDLPAGVVPRELMIGRAFFVYWPAAHRLRPDWIGLIPNFGHMRYIR